MLLSSHDLAEVDALADRVAVFVAGRLAALGGPGELVRSLALPASLRLALRAPSPGALAAAERAGARRIHWDGAVLHCDVCAGEEASVLEALRDAGAIVTELAVRNPGLEEIYRAVTGAAAPRVA